MLKTTAAAALKTAFWVAAAGVLVLSLVPTSPELPSTGWDKSNHLFGFLTLAVLGLPAYPSRRLPLVIGLLFFGGLVEGLQSLTSYRLAEWADWFADALGIGVGYGLQTLYCRCAAKVSKATKASAG